MFWKDEEFKTKFYPVSVSKSLPYQYRKWSKMFTSMIGELDDWRILSIAWSAAVCLPEVLAADEKNKKNRCKRNPLVSMVGQYLAT